MDDYSMIPQSENYEISPFSLMVGTNSQRVAKHKVWLQNIRHETPNPNTKYRIGVYIRYFNQTRYDNYLDFHKKQFTDSIGLCPNWTLVDFYIDEGSIAPYMESSPELSRLLEDCMNGKVDLIVTQKVSNFSRDPIEINICASMLASQKHPIGIYFISEDIFTLATYYQDDIRDTHFLPEGYTPLIEDEIGEDDDK